MLNMIMKKKRWIILICIVVILTWIVAWLYYYSCTEVSNQSAICAREDENCTLDIEPTEKYCSFYNIPYKLWFKNTLNEKLDEKYKEDYKSWKKTCEYVNTHYQCWRYDCSKKWYRKNYNLCWDEFTSITE